MSEETMNEEPEDQADDNEETETGNVENFPGAERAEPAEGAEIEDIEAEQAEPTPEERLDALVEENADLKDRLLRAVAETENVRRRAQRDKEDMAKYAISNFSRDMLGVADNMRRAIDSVDEEVRKNDGAVENLLIGVEMTERELLAAFDRTGIKRMEPIGLRFDPNIHEAMFEYDDTEQPAGTVGQVIEPGYTLHSRALRPAKVGITKGGPKVDKTAAATVENPVDNGVKTLDEEPPADTTAYDKGTDQAADQVGEHLNEEL